MNANEELAEAVAEEEAAPVVSAPEPRQLIGGEVHIIADAKTGAVNVQAPPNLAVALGLIELAKVILIQQHLSAMQTQQRNRPPAIIPAGVDALKNLGKLQ